MTAIHICFEGTEGCYKTTNAKALAEKLRLFGFSVLETKEPGTPHLPLTMKLRAIMLDSQYENEMTRQARELISQAIRSIHVDKLIEPSRDKYDFIIQDRGSMSGMAYGMACGNDHNELEHLLCFIKSGGISSYDKIIYLQGDAAAGLKQAAEAKQEFAAGDAMEARGIAFMESVGDHFLDLIDQQDNVDIINVLNKSREEILDEILQVVLKPLIDSGLLKTIPKA